MSSCRRTDDKKLQENPVEPKENKCMAEVPGEGDRPGVAGDADRETTTKIDDEDGQGKDDQDKEPKEIEDAVDQDENMKIDDVDGQAGALKKIEDVEDGQDQDEAPKKIEDVVDSQDQTTEED